MSINYSAVLLGMEKYRPPSKLIVIENHASILNSAYVLKTKSKVLGGYSV